MHSNLQGEFIQVKQVALSPPAPGTIRDARIRGHGRRRGKEVYATPLRFCASRVLTAYEMSSRERAQLAIAARIIDLNKSNAVSVSDTPHERPPSAHSELSPPDDATLAHSQQLAQARTQPEPTISQPELATSPKPDSTTLNKTNASPLVPGQTILLSINEETSIDHRAHALPSRTLMLFKNSNSGEILSTDFLGRIRFWAVGGSMDRY